jgi:hypothetical protein
LKRRYACRIGSVGIIREMIDVWMVITTDEVPHEEVLAAGFDEVPADLSDEEVKARFGVTEIYEVTDSRRRAVVN